MTLVENYAAERRARLVRLGAIPTNSIATRLTEADMTPLKFPPVKIDVPPAECFWPSLWCWDLVTMPQRYPSLCKTIQSVVAAEFNIAVIEMRSSRRSNNVVIPRWVAMYLCRSLMEWSLPQIGRHFGGKDHTTVLHGIERVEAMMEMDFDFRTKVQTIMSRFA